MTDTPTSDPAEDKPVGAAFGGGGGDPSLQHGRYIQGGRWLSGGSPHAPSLQPPKPPGSGDLAPPGNAGQPADPSLLGGGGGGQG